MSDEKELEEEQLEEVLEGEDIPGDELDAIMQELEDIDDEEEAEAEAEPEASEQVADTESQSEDIVAESETSEVHPIADTESHDEAVAAKPAISAVIEEEEAEEEIGSVSEPVEVQPAPAPVHELNPVRETRMNDLKTSADGQSLNLQLGGNIKMRLSFESGTKSVELDFTGDVLICRFGDGTEIRMPTDNPQATTLKSA